MDFSRAVILVTLFSCLGCGGPEGSTSYTSCDERTSCRGEVCTTVEDCLIDECEWEVTYLFAGEEYESTCTYGPEITTTVYPIAGGSGRKTIERDLQECYYEYEVQFYDYDEEGSCTSTYDCTRQLLSCSPSTKGDPSCSVVDQSACAR